MIPFCRVWKSSFFNQRKLVLHLNSLWNVFVVLSQTEALGIRANVSEGREVLLHDAPLRSAPAVQKHYVCTDVWGGGWGKEAALA